MTRGPDKKEIEKDVLIEVVEEVGPAGVEQIKEKYNEKASDTISWNTCKDRLEMNEDYETVEACKFTFWKVSYSE